MLAKQVLKNIIEELKDQYESIGAETRAKYMERVKVVCNAVLDSMFEESENYPDDSLGVVLYFRQQEEGKEDAPYHLTIELTFLEEAPMTAVEICAKFEEYTGVYPQVLVWERTSMHPPYSD